MPDAFDPYYVWLGIPPREQPVNYYRLLGLELYETNLQAIANAADRQMSYIRTFQTGAHSQESQTILNEIAKARVTLLNETRKSEYDNNLRSQVFQGEVPSIAPPVPETPPVSSFNGAPPVPDAPQVFSFNVFSPVEPPSAGSSNSTVQKLGDVSKAERLRRKTKPRRTDEEEKAKRNKILMIGSVGSGVLVLLTILVLVISFSRSPSTPALPSGHEEELADTSQKTSQAIEKPSDVVELPTPMQTPSGLSNVAGARRVETVKGVEFAFRWCPPGTFIMGSPETEEGREPSWGGKETQHSVTLTQGFWMLETEVTQAQWKAIMGNNPSSFKGDDLPVENVNWNDCQEFCRKCKDLGLPVQLPTDAQWEYACRAGSTTRYCFGESDDYLYKYCNYCDKSNTSGRNYQDKDHDDGYDKTAPVKSLQPNAWGLYDMHGNVYEWCSDIYVSDLTTSSVTDPKGPESGSVRVRRGDGWIGEAKSCRSAFRLKDSPGSRSYDLGFRLSLGQ